MRITKKLNINKLYFKKKFAIMGCHTWCYAHIPEKSEEWKTQYKEIARKNLESSRQNIKLNKKIIKIISFY